MCHRLSPKAQAGEPPPRSGGRASEIEGSAGLALDGGGVGSLSHASVQPPGVPGPLRHIWVTWDACGSCWLWLSGGQGAVTPGLYPQATCTPYPETLSAADIRSQLRAMSLLALRGLGVWAGWVHRRGPLCLPSTVPLGTACRLSSQGTGTPHGQQVPETVCPRLRGHLGSCWPGLPGPSLDRFPPRLPSPLLASGSRANGPVRPRVLLGGQQLAGA